MSRCYQKEPGNVSTSIRSASGFTFWVMRGQRQFSHGLMRISDLPPSAMTDMVNDSAGGVDLLSLCGFLECCKTRKREL